jgi:hypothetical protein
MHQQLDTAVATLREVATSGCYVRPPNPGHLIRAPADCEQRPHGYAVDLALVEALAVRSSQLAQLVCRKRVVVHAGEEYTMLVDGYATVVS